MNRSHQITIIKSAHHGHFPELTGDDIIQYTDSHFSPVLIFCEQKQQEVILRNIIWNKYGLMPFIQTIDPAPIFKLLRTEVTWDDIKEYAHSRNISEVENIEDALLWRFWKKYPFQKHYYYSSSSERIVELFHNQHHIPFNSLQRFNIEGIEFLVENTKAQHVLQKMMMRIMHNPQTPDLIKTLIQLTKSGVNTGQITICAHDVERVGRNAAALTEMHSNGFRKIHLRARDAMYLHLEACHEFAHAVLPLANPNYKFHTPKMRQAFATDFWEYTRNRNSYVPIQRNVADWIFHKPQSYPIDERFAERVAFTMQSIAHSENAVKSVAPRFYEVVKNCVNNQNQLIGLLVSKQLNQFDPIVKNWDVPKSQIIEGYQPELKEIALFDIKKNNSPLVRSMSFSTINGRNVPVEVVGADETFIEASLINVDHEAHAFTSFQGAKGLLKKGWRPCLNTAIPALTALDIALRYQHELSLFPDSSDLGHKAAVATDFGIDWGTFSLLAKCSSHGLAGATLFPLAIISDLAVRGRNVSPEELRNNRDFFLTKISSLELSPALEYEWLAAFDRGEEWTREFNVHTVSYNKTITKPLVFLHDVKTSVVDFFRNAGDYVDQLIDKIPEPVSLNNTISGIPFTAFPNITTAIVDAKRITTISKIMSSFLERLLPETDTKVDPVEGTFFPLPDFTIEQPEIASLNFQNEQKEENTFTNNDNSISGTFEENKTELTRVLYVEEEVVPQRETAHIDESDYQLSKFRFGQAMNDSITLYHYSLDGNNAVSLSLKISGGTFTYISSLEVSLNEGILMGFKGLMTSPLFWLGLGITATGWFYDNYQKHKLARTIRHLKNHAREATHDLKKFQKWYANKILQLQNTFQNDPTKIDQVIKSDNKKFHEQIRDIRHKADYAYHHGAYNAEVVYCSQVQNLRQMRLDLNNTAEIEKKYNSAISSAKNQYADLTPEELLTKLNPLLGHSVLTEAQMLEAMGLRNLIRDKCFEEGKLDLLRNNIFLLETKLGKCYHLPTLNVPPTIQPRHFKGKDRTEKSEHVYILMSKLNKLYEECKDAVENHPELIETKVNAYNSFLAKSIPKLKAFKLTKFDDLENLDNLEIPDKLETAYDWCYLFYIKPSKEILQSVNQDLNNKKNTPSNVTIELDIPQEYVNAYYDFILKNDKSSTDMVALTKSVIKEENSLTRDFRLAGASKLSLDQIFSLALHNKFSEAKDLLAKLSKITYKTKDENERFIDPSLNDKLQEVLNFVETHENAEPEFWLHQLDESAKTANSPSQNHIENDLAHRKQWLCTQEYLNAVNEKAHLGFYHDATKMLSDLQQHSVSPQIIPYLQNKENYFTFKNAGQLLGLALNTVHNVLESEVNHMHSSPNIKKVATSTFTAIHSVQRIIPNFLPLSVQGLHACLKGDMNAFLMNVGELPGEVWSTLTTPHRNFNSFMLYAQLLVNGFNHFPVEKIFPNKSRGRNLIIKAKHSTKSNSHLAFRVTNVLHAGHLVLEDKFKHALQPLNLLTTLHGVIDFAAFLFQRYLIQPDYASENPSFYKFKEGLVTLASISVLAQIILKSSDITFGFGLMTLISVFELYKYRNSGALSAAENALSEAISHIEACNEIINKIHQDKDYKPAVVNSQEQMAKTAIDSSFKSIEKTLKSDFSGLKYSIKQPERVNHARILHLTHLIRKSIEEKDYAGTIALSTIVELKGGIGEIGINNNYQIPLNYHLWELIHFRLIALAESNQHLSSFKREYDVLAPYIFHQAPTEWHNKYAQGIKESLNKLVHYALFRFLDSAYKKNDETLSREYLSYILSDYQYCKKWSDLMDSRVKEDNQFLFNAASLAYIIGEKNKCCLFLKYVNFARLFENNIATHFTYAHLCMLDEYEATPTPYRTLLEMMMTIPAQNIIHDYVLNLINQKRYPLAINLLERVGNCPGKYYLYAFAVYFSSNEEDIVKSLELLFKESRKDLAYWILLYQIIDRCYESFIFIQDITRSNNCFGFFSITLKVIANNILKHDVKREFYEKIEPNIQSYHDNLKIYIKQKSAKYNASKSSPTEEEIEATIEHLTQESHRSIAGDSFNIPLSIDKMLLDLSYEFTENLGVKRFTPLRHKSDNLSIFSALNTTKENCINSLIQQITAPQFSHSLFRQNQQPRKNLMEPLIDFIDRIRNEKHNRAESALNDNIKIITDELLKILNSEEELYTSNAEIVLLKAISVMADKHIRLFTLKDSKNMSLSLAYNQDSSIMVDILEIEIENKKIYVKLVPLERSVSKDIKNQVYLPSYAPDPIEKAVIVSLESKTKIPEVKITSKVEPSTAQQCYEIGLNFKRQSDDRAAIESFRKAIEIDNNHAPSHFEIGCLYLTRNNFDEAKEHLKQAEKLGHNEAYGKLFLLENSQLSTAEQWLNKGDSFLEKKPPQEKDWVCARLCYEKVIEIKPTHSAALYNLGLLFDSASGVNRNEKFALDYFNKAAKQGHEKAKIIIAGVKINNFKNEKSDRTTQEWHELGEKYRKQFSKDYDPHLAQACYQEATKIAAAKIIELKNEKSDRTDKEWHNLGDSFCSRDVKKDDRYMARACYQEAANLQYYPSIQRLLLMEYGSASSTKWYNLGLNYLQALNNFSLDPIRARACFEWVANFDKNENYIGALFQLGLLYENGNGVKVDLAKATGYFQRAADLKDTESQNHLKLLKLYRDNQVPVSASDWFQLGWSYFGLTDPNELNYESARICFEKAFEKDRYHVNVSDLLGNIYYYGKGVQNDLSKALGYFHLSENRGYIYMIYKDEPSLANAELWYELAEYYRHPKDPKDYIHHRAYECYQEGLRLNSSHNGCLRGMSSLHYGSTACDYLGKAAVGGCEVSRRDLLSKLGHSILYWPPEPANEWYKIGYSYEFGVPGVISSDFNQARIYYEIALSHDAGHHDALQAMGRLHEFIFNDPRKAREFYDRVDDVAGVNRLRFKSPDAAWEWETKGMSYFLGTDGLPKDDIAARQCFEEAIFKEPTRVDSLRRLGNIYEYGYGVAVDIDKAKIYYRRGAQEACSLCKKKLTHLNTRGKVIAAAVINSTNQAIDEVIQGFGSLFR